MCAGGGGATETWAGGAGLAGRACEAWEAAWAEAPRPGDHSGTRQRAGWAEAVGGTAGLQTGRTAGALHGLNAEGDGERASGTLAEEARAGCGMSVWVHGRDRGDGDSSGLSEKGAGSGVGSWSQPSCTAHRLCDLGPGAQPLWASVSSSVKGARSSINTLKLSCVEVS